MKKVILSAGALMCGAIAFAQVSGSEINPTEAANISGAPGDANRVEADQTGILGTVLVRQEGTDQSVYIQQSGGSEFSSLGNQIYVLQSGEVGDDTSSGLNNEAEVIQSDLTIDQRAFVYQQGDNNEGVVHQKENSIDNDAYIQQGNNNQAENNQARIDQQGEGNISQILQRWDNNTAYNIQDGDGHSSLIQQATGSNGASPGSIARVEQYGDNQMSEVNQSGVDNTADIDQSNGSGTGGNASLVIQSGGPDNDATVTQAGTQNKANINSSGNDQDSDVTQTGTLNMADVDQTGIAGNNSEVFQNGEGNYARQIQNNAVSGGSDNDALINQGDDNEFDTMALSGLYSATNALNNSAVGTQSSDSHNGIAFQNQNGEGNRAQSHQFGEDEIDWTAYAGFFTISGTDDVAPNRSNQIQEGSDNDALVVQNAYGDPNQTISGTISTIFGTFGASIEPRDGFNHATQEQYGEGNDVSIIQTNHGNRSWQRQGTADGDTATNSRALAVQKGLGQTLVSLQVGDGNRMHTDQDGGFNTIYAMQDGGQVFTGSQSGAFNSMQVAQWGSVDEITFSTGTMDCNIPGIGDPGELSMPGDPQMPPTLPNDICVPDC